MSFTHYLYFSLKFVDNSIGVNFYCASRLESLSPNFFRGYNRQGEVVGVGAPLFHPNLCQCSYCNHTNIKLLFNSELTEGRAIVFLPPWRRRFSCRRRRVEASDDICPAPRAEIRFPLRLPWCWNAKGAAKHLCLTVYLDFSNPRDFGLNTRILS